LKEEKLTKDMVEAYAAVCALGNDWSDKNLAAHNLGAGHLWYAMRVHATIDDFLKRTGLRREDISLITNPATERVFLQWKYAAGNPLPLKLAA
jgi:hypothetical protein